MRVDMRAAMREPGVHHVVGAAVLAALFVATGLRHARTGARPGAAARALPNDLADRRSE